MNLPTDDLEHILTHTEPVWADLRGTRLFITGGTGFIGTWLLDSLQWANRRLGADVEATVLTRDPDGFRRRMPHLAADPAINLHSGDIRAFSRPDGTFSHVIHAATAASAKLNTEAPLVMIDTIVEGTRRALDFAVHCGAGTFLHTSSGGIYGKQPPELLQVPEDYSGAPDPMDLWSCYSEGKRLAELLGAIYSHQHQFAHKVSRITALVGPRLPLDIHFAMGNFIRDAFRGGPIRIEGDGTPYRSYLYIADLIIWLWVILVKGASNRPYNAGSDEAISILDTARSVNAAFGNQFEITVAKAPVPGVPASRYVPSTKRAREELGLRQWVDLATAVRKTVDWYRRAGTGW